MKIRYSEKISFSSRRRSIRRRPLGVLRTFGCNFSCHAFGQSRNKDEQKSVEDMPYMTDPRADPSHPDAYKDISELPVTPLGCDSSASWAAKYKHLQVTASVDDLVEDLLDLVPGRSFVGADGQDYHLVITGGEPLLGWQRAWPELLGKLMQHGLSNVTFETNGTQLIKPEFVHWLNNEGKDLHITWSTSPKLSISGEDPAEACNPQSLLTMNLVENSYLYNKFVVRDAQCFEEVHSFVDKYKTAGVCIDSIYCMPEGATLDQITLTEKDVAEECMRTGYRFSPRLHLNLFRNAWGT